MRFRIVTIGTSLGGLDALGIVLRGLPKTFPLPVAVVQHRSQEDSEGIVPILSAKTDLHVVEVEDKAELEPGCVFVCPPNYHLLVDGGHLALSTDLPVMFARPSIDVLFESAADTCGSEVVAVLLTGMSRDGSAGAARIKECGGVVVVQDPKTAEAPTMPQAAISAGAADKVLPLQDIARYLVELCATEVKGSCPMTK